MLLQLLVFPVAVVVLAFVSFVFGGHCAAWQWWAAAAIAMAAGFWRRPMHDGVRTAVLFLAWMAVAWVGCGLAVAPNWFDEAVYHIPAVRMLADGWNPLYVSTPEALLRLTGFAETDFRVDHVLFMPKTVWVFSAVAYFFTSDVLNPLVPILWFLVPAVLIRIWRSMDGAALVWRILVVPLVYCLLFNSAYVVDVVVQLAAIGLLLSFEEALSGEKVDALSLAVFSFWMMGAKTTGLLHCGFFWAIFLVVVLVRKQDWRPFAKVAAAVAVLLSLACSTPYFTSLRHYGNPFYPKYSIDEKRFPVKDLTHDFVTRRNEDAAQMGYAGLYVNAFISPALAREYYKRKLDKPDFMPYSQVYSQYPNDGDGASPTSFAMRLAFWSSIALLLLVGRKSFRPIALMALLGMLAVPAPMLGYIRYIPWWLLPMLFLYIALVRGGGRMNVVLACIVLLGTFSIPPYTLPNKIGYTLKLVDERRRMKALLDDIGSTTPPIRPSWYESFAQLTMMRRLLPSLAKAEVLPYSAALVDGLREEDAELPGKLFVFDDANETRRMALRIPHDTFGRMKYAMHSGFVSLPCAVAARIASLWSNKEEGAS